jgi:hypothetical protein
MKRGEKYIMDPIIGMFALISYIVVFFVACPIGITLVLYQLFDSPRVLGVKKASPFVLQGEALADTSIIIATNVSNLQES